MFAVVDPAAVWPAMFAARTPLLDSSLSGPMARKARRRWASPMGRGHRGGRRRHLEAGERGSDWPRAVSRRTRIDRWCKERPGAELCASCWLLVLAKADHQLSRRRRRLRRRRRRRRVFPCSPLYSVRKPEKRRREPPVLSSYHGTACGARFCAQLFSVRSLVLASRCRSGMASTMRGSPSQVAKTRSSRSGPSPSRCCRERGEQLKIRGEGRSLRLLLGA